MKKSTIAIGVLVVGIVSVLAIRAYNKKKLDEYFEEEDAFLDELDSIMEFVNSIDIDTLSEEQKSLYDEVVENASKIIGTGIELDEFEELLNEFKESLGMELLMVKPMKQQQNLQQISQRILQNLL